MNKNINTITWLYSIALILLGISGFAITGMQSITALIPSFFGIIMIIVNLLIHRSDENSKYIWILIILGVIGFSSTVTGIPKTINMISGQDIVRPAAAISQSIMSVLSLLYSIVMLLEKRKVSGN